MSVLQRYSVYTKSKHLKEAANKPKKYKKVDNHTKGVMHELLVGHHLLGRHMDHHADKEGIRPHELHDQLKASMSPEDYNKINARAKAAAEHLRQHIESHGHSIHDVHWTSKPGDLHKSTGIHASQKEDASDIVIHAKDKNGNTVHHGVSLKVTDKTSPHVGVATSGRDAAYGAHKYLDAFRAHIKKKFPNMPTRGGKQARKKYVETLPQHDQDHISERQTETNRLAAKHVYDHLMKGGKEAIADHARQHIFASHQTPMQKAGHFHWRFTTHKSGNGFGHHVINPHEHYEHMLSDHKNLTIKHTGTSVTFFYKGKAIGKHNMKMNSKSDPHSAMESRGLPSV